MMSSISRGPVALLFVSAMSCTHVRASVPEPHGALVRGHRLPEGEIQRRYLDGIPAPCGQHDSTVQCCLKQNPGQYERCGALPPEPKPDPKNPRVPPIDPAPPKEPEPDDEGWRDQCIDLYVRCKQRGWGAVREWNCHECLRNCQGQREWPFHLCGPSI